MFDFGSAGFSSMEISVPSGVRLGDAVALGVANPVAEQDAAVLQGRGVTERPAQAVAVEDVVAEHEGRDVRPDVVGADPERLRQPVGLRLHRVADGQAQVGAVAEQPDELLLVVRSRDDEDVADAGQHERRERVVDHRLVVDG